MEASATINHSWRNDRNNETTMDRRKFMIGLGSIGAVTVGGAALTGSAAAQVEINDYDFDDTRINGISDTGDLTGVEVRADDIEIGYTGLESGAEFAAVILSTGPDHEQIVDYDVRSVAPKTTNENVDFGSLSGDITDKTGYTVSEFESNEDGEVTTTDIDLTLTVVVFYDTKDPVDSSVVEDHINTGDNLDSGLSQLEGNEGEYYEHVDDDISSMLVIEMENREEETDIGADVGGSVETGE